jgi:hypothetical protein
MGVAGTNSLCTKAFPNDLSIQQTTNMPPRHPLCVPTYIFFSTRCKFFLGKLQSLFNLATTDKLNEALLLQVEKQLGIRIQYLSCPTILLEHI